MPTLGDQQLQRAGHGPGRGALFFGLVGAAVGRLVNRGGRRGRGRRGTRELEAEIERLRKRVLELEGDGEAVNALSLPELRTLSLTLDSARGRVQERVIAAEVADKVKNQLQCPVCLDASKAIVFGCGHSTCRDCSARVNNCPICRDTISTRVVRFD